MRNFLPKNCCRLAGTIILILSLAGCSTVSVPDSSVPNLYLSQGEKRVSGLTSAQLPAGEYVPDFQTESGIYYVAPRRLAINGLGISQAMKGGLFIPHSNNPDQTQALWFDNQENGAGVFTALATAQTRLYPFKPPLPFNPPLRGQRNQVTAPPVTGKVSQKVSPAVQVASGATDDSKIYFYSPYDEGRTNLLSAPQSDRGKTGICPLRERILLSRRFKMPI